MSFQTVKSRCIGVTASLVLFSLVATLGVAQTIQNNSNWQLVWWDEFNGAAGSLPDANKWTYDVGGGGWGNNEEEYYCAAGSNSYPCYSATPNSVLDGNGNLVVSAIYNGSTWTSARMKTQGVENLQYGRIEARMKLPMGAGIWPAFWVLDFTVGAHDQPKISGIAVN